MHTAVSNRDPERFSPRALARIYGGIGLFGIAAGFFDIGYIHSQIVVGGDAAATAQNLLAHEGLFRSGIALHLLMVLLNVLAEVLGYFIFRRVNPLIATMALCAGLVGAAVEGLDMLGSLLPLQLGGVMGVFSPAQLQALTYASLQLQDTGLQISFLFWGLEEILTGYLIFRSGFLPRVLGILLSIAGFVYVSNPLLSFGLPAIGDRLFPAGLALCLPGEFLIALWTATVGLNAAKWRELHAPTRAD